MKLSERIRTKVTHTITTNELKLWADLVLVLEAQIPQWISVKDRLPDNNTEVLTVTGKEIIIALYLYEDFYVDGVIEEGFIFTPSHWMPLPKAPKEE